ncbi:uncharacterized protein [Onthophagus taurus]|uniref:uncharacterized protein n=1 Tax=Onthophagus taurus TaxID=166361 RepID=UPI0039BE25A0
MTQKYFLLVIIMGILIEMGAYGQICYRMPTVKDFKLAQIMGNWYPQEIASEIEVTKRCVYYVVRSDDKPCNATITIDRFWDNGKNDTFKMYQINNTSEFRIDWLGKIRRNWLIAMDYDSWSLWYICYSENHDNSAVVISTRESRRNETVINEAKKAMKNIKLNSIYSKMKEIDRSNCE